MSVNENINSLLIILALEYTFQRVWKWEGGKQKWQVWNWLVLLILSQKTQVIVISYLVLISIVVLNKDYLYKLIK